MLNEKNYFGGMGAEEEPKKAPVSDKGKMEHGDEGVTIHVSKNGDKLHTSIDKHDGYPPDEMDHDSPEEAAAAHQQALEEKYGEAKADEDAEEKVSPGVHKKASDYLAEEK